MKNLNRWLILIANIGVVVVLIILAVQIQQHSELMKSQTRDSMTSSLMIYLATAYSDDDLMKTLSGRDEPPFVEYKPTSDLIRYKLFLLAGFRLLENEWYQHQKDYL
jgi:hypothetical protein